MKTGLAALPLALLTSIACVSCGPPPPPKPLPADLLPPEYETPRGYDLGGPKSAPTAAPAAPAPTAAPAAPAPSAPPPPKKP